MVKTDGSMRVEVEHDGKKNWKVIVTNPQLNIRLAVWMTGAGLMFETPDGIIELGPNGPELGPPVNGYVIKG